MVFPPWQGLNLLFGALDGAWRAVIVTPRPSSDKARGFPFLNSAPREIQSLIDARRLRKVERPVANPAPQRAAGNAKLGRQLRRRD